MSCVVRLTCDRAENKEFMSGEQTCNDSFDPSNKMRPTTSVAVCPSPVSLHLSVAIRRRTFGGPESSSHSAPITTSKSDSATSFTTEGASWRRGETSPRSQERIQLPGLNLIHLKTSWRTFLENLPTFHFQIHLLRLIFANAVHIRLL